MKNIHIVLAFYSMLTIAVNCPAQQPVREVLYSLQADESLVYNENCFYFTEKNKDIFIVTRKAENFFVIDNGVRKGPFERVPNEMLRSCKGEFVSCAAHEPSLGIEDSDYNQHVIQNDDGSISIKFGAKTFGPYSSLLQLAFAENRSKIHAVVMGLDGKKLYINSSGKTLPLEGMPQSLIVSPDGNLALIKYGIDYDSQNFDPTRFTMEQLMQFHILTSEGLKFGPYDGNTVTDYDIWFCKTSGNHWYMKANNNLLGDGKILAKMPESTGRCDLWFNAEGNKFAIFTYERILFPDGTSIPYPMMINTFSKDGKTFLRCISLENGKDIVAYVKAL